MHRKHGLKTVFMAGREHSAVVLELRGRELARLGLDSRPLDREAVGIEAERRKQRNIFSIAVIVIAGVARWFRVECAVDMFE